MTFDREKAQQASEELIPPHFLDVAYFHGGIKVNYAQYRRDLFIKGAEWQSKQPIVVTDEMVERGIPLLINQGWTCDGHEPDPDCRECYRLWQKDLRAVLEAVLGGAE